MENTSLKLKKTDNYFKLAKKFIVNTATAKPHLLYFFLVLIIYAVIYIPLLLQGKMYIYLDIGADTYVSYWPMYAFIRDYFHDFQFSGWSFQHGLGGSVIYAAPWIFDPFNLFIVPFGKSNIDTGIFLAATAKVFTLAVLAFAYMRRLGYKEIPLIASSITYTFCGFFIGWGQHYQFATLFVLFTLVLFCLEGWLQSRHWLGLVVSVALLASYWPYALFMTLVFLAIYYLFRYYQLFPLTWMDFMTRSISSAGLILLGIALGSIFFLPQAYIMTQSTRIAFRFLPSLSLATIKEYYTMFMRLFSSGLLGVNYFSGEKNYYEAPFLYTSILAIILAPRLFFNDLRKRNYVWVLAICGFSLVFPNVVNPIFGAFSSNSSRWTFVLVPVFAVTLAEALFVIKDNSHKWIYSLGILLAIGASLAAFLSDHPSDPDFRRLSIPISISIVIISAFLYGVVLYRFKKPNTLYYLLAILVLEVALTGFVSVNWRGTVPVYEKAKTPYFDSSANTALGTISSTDNSFFRINKNFDYIYWTDALFQNFYGEKQYASITPSYIWDLESSFGLNRARTNYLSGFSGRQALRDISAVKYMLTKQNDLYAGYEFVTQVGNTYIFRNKNASSLGIIYKNYITLDNFKELDWAARQYILYDAAIVSNDAIKNLSALNEVYRPLLEDSSAINLDRNFDYYQTTVIENDFPVHLMIESKGNDPQISVTFLEPAISSIAVKFSVTSSKTNTGKIYFKTPNRDFNEYDSVSFTLLKGTHDYYFTIPMIGINAIRLDVAEIPGKFSIDDLEVLHRDDKEISERASSLSQDIHIDMFENDYIRATASLDSGSLVYFSIPFDEGWKIYVDGILSKKIRANLAFTGVYVGSGVHTIELKYSVPWLKVGTAISIAAFVLIIILKAITQKSRSF